LREILGKNTLDEGQKQVTRISNVVVNGPGFETSSPETGIEVDGDVKGAAKMAYLWVQGWRRQLGAAGDMVEYCRSGFDLYEYIDE
jgi:hypothetical protein